MLSMPLNTYSQRTECFLRGFAKRNEVFFQHPTPHLKLVVVYFSSDVAQQGQKLSRGITCSDIRIVDQCPVMFLVC